MSHIAALKLYCRLDTNTLMLKKFMYMSAQVKITSLGGRIYNFCKVTSVTIMATFF